TELVCPCFVEDMSDSSQHTPGSPHFLPTLSPRYFQSWPPYFYAQSSHCFENGWSVDGELFPLPCGLPRWDCLRYHPRMNYARKWGTEVVQSESQKEPQMPPGEVDKDKDSNVEETNEPLRGLRSTSEKELEPETCDGGDCPERDASPDRPGSLSCWPWLPKAFGLK
uniref:Uncharacterized protein n=1 Tax=Cricetulus griseus TaxID=10029 RepID=A0A8C2LRI4_CRIGR